MKRCLNILIIFCVLFTTSSLKAEDKPLPESQEKFDKNAFLKRLFPEPVDVNSDEYKKERYKDFIDIKSFAKGATYVYFLGDDAEKIGLDEKELTDYLRLRIKNNFANIKIGGPYSTVKELGSINLRVHILGDNYPVAYHLKFQFSHCGDSQIDASVIWDNDFMLGYGSKDTVPDSIRKTIDVVIRDLAILFFKVRGEL